jgi:hypothetical protein
MALFEPKRDKTEISGNILPNRRRARIQTAVAAKKMFSPKIEP